MRPRSVMPVLLVALVFIAGCLAGPAPSGSGTPVATTVFSASHPSMAKFTAKTDPTNPNQTVPEKLMRTPPHMSQDIQVPLGTARMQVAVDVRQTVADPTGSDNVQVRIQTSDGKVRTTFPRSTGPSKFLTWIDAPAPGAAKAIVEYNGTWTVGVVAVFVPTGYTPGLEIHVAHPNETQINHTFDPENMTVVHGQPVRFTLYDYDPHTGVQVLQHNLDFPDLGQKTDGKTTWGEVRILDFTAPMKPGTYHYECEFHPNSLKGTLTVT